MNDLTKELQSLSVSSNEYIHLTAIITSYLHHTIIDIVLTHLSTEDKQIFLQYVATNDHEKIWKMLLQKTENIENKIKEAAEKLQEEFLQDIKQAKKTH